MLAKNEHVKKKKQSKWTFENRKKYNIKINLLVGFNFRSGTAAKSMNK